MLNNKLESQTGTPLPSQCPVRRLTMIESPDMPPVTIPNGSYTRFTAKAIHIVPAAIIIRFLPFPPAKRSRFIAILFSPEKDDGYLPSSFV